MRLPCSQRPVLLRKNWLLRGFFVAMEVFVINGALTRFLGGGVKDWYRENPHTKKRVEGKRALINVSFLRIIMIIMK